MFDSPIFLLVVLVCGIGFEWGFSNSFWLVKSNGNNRNHKIFYQSVSEANSTAKNEHTRYTYLRSQQGSVRSSLVPRLANTRSPSQYCSNFQVLDEPRRLQPMQKIMGCREHPRGCKYHPQADLGRQFGFRCCSHLHLLHHSYKPTPPFRFVGRQSHPCYYISSW